MIRASILILTLSSMIFSPVKSAPWKLEGIVTPEGRGTISPQGEYADGTKVNVTIAANPGWFLLDLSTAHAVADNLDGLDNAALNLLVVTEIGDGYVTNMSAATTMKSDTEVHAVFWPLAPDFVPLSPVTTASDFTLSTEAEGFWPMTFKWSKDGVPIPGQSGTFARRQTSAKLSFTNVDQSMSGTYSLTVENAFGSESSSVTVDVRPILCVELGGDPIITNNVSFTNSFFFELDTIFKNGHIFYTLDGSEPTFASPEYLNPITLTDTSDLRAVSYSSDLATSALLGPIYFEKASIVALSYWTTGQGVIEGKTDGQTENVAKDSTIMLRAIPNEGSFFVAWNTPDFDDRPEITIEADHDMSIRATFTSPISVPVGGPGTVEIQPNSPGYVAGASVGLYPKPAPGSYFVRWLERGGSTVPYQLSAINELPPTALFASLPPGKVSLTVISKGPGLISGLTTNLFSVGSSITLEAKPSTGEKFLRWSGDVASTDTTLTLDMTASKTIYAEFENPPKLSFDSQHQQVFVNNPLGLGSVIDLFSSPNLFDWHLEFSKTNFAGYVLENWTATNSANFFKALQRDR